MFKFVSRSIPMNYRPLDGRRLASTIYALSTGLNDRGTPIAVIRISGQSTLDGLSALMDSKQFSKLQENPRKAIFSPLINPSTNELIDKGLVLWFPRPKSFTGENTAELHVHGSKAVVSSLLKILGSLPDFKPAKEGEFTRRAFLNGKLNLIEAEGLASLISSRTDSQRSVAMQALDGHIGRLYSQWRSTLLRSISHLEAIINFAEDELIDESVLDRVKGKLNQLKINIRHFLDEATRKSELVQNGINMAIIGLPNVGKSTLLNKLCRRDLSIISPISGTTRDVVEGLLDFKGWPVRICDTAGLKETVVDDPIEEEGIKRAKQRAIGAHLILLVMDGPSLLLAEDGKLDFNKYIKPFDDITKGANVIHIINKLDLLNESETSRLRKILPEESSVMISCETEQSFDLLLDLIEWRVETISGTVENEELFITERHQSHLQRIIEGLDGSMRHFDEDLALAAHYLNQCIGEIAQLTGDISTEDILDVIFKDFCIGK